jgi:hypothetical protein
MENLREKLKREQQLVIQLEKDLQNREMALQLARYLCIHIFSRNRCCDPESEIHWDPTAFLTPYRDPRWLKIKIRIGDEHPGSYFRELGNNFFCLKY